jgi:hypothetical protein
LLIGSHSQVPTRGWLDERSTVVTLSWVFISTCSLSVKGIDVAEWSVIGAPLHTTTLILMHVPGIWLFEVEIMGIQPFRQP